MRAQVERDPLLVLEIDVEGVLHRARRMGLRGVERREAVPVGLDLGPFGDIEAERLPDRLDALPAADHRVHAAATAAARGQRHIERLLGKPRRELLAGELVAPVLERGLDSLLGGVELRASHFALLRSSLRTKCGQLARFAEEARFRVLEGRDITRRAERGERARNDGVQVLQLGATQCAKFALTWPAILSKAALSVTARSARTLRSMSRFARFRPAITWLY